MGNEHERIMADERAERAFRKRIGTPPLARGATRREIDSLGEKLVPADVYWGINVSRAIENFSISGRAISDYPDLIFGYACVKQAAARANTEIGVLDRSKALLIDRVCEEIKGGKLDDQFIVDIMQGGTGASTDMNVNEVIANRGLELAGYPRATYGYLDPKDHVNRSQVTNDTYSTALKIGLCLSIERLLAELGLLCRAFDGKAREFGGRIKPVRTQQGAAPMTLEQAFRSFAATLAEDHAGFESVLERLWVINLAATSLGMERAGDERYAASVCRHLAKITGYEIVPASNLVAATDVSVFTKLSGMLKRSAMKLSKICSDLRVLSSETQTGAAAIKLPPRQAESLTGNPVIPEVVSEVAFVVAGGDAALTLAAEAGQRQPNAFQPVIAHVLFENLKWLTAAMTTLRENCVIGITGNTRRAAREMQSFVGAITALVPHIGYDPAARIAERAIKTNESIEDLIVSGGLLTREQAAALLARERIVGNRSL